MIRFPALLTTGMHGTEHCDQERRTLRLSAPRNGFLQSTGSMLPGTPLAASFSGPGARNGLSLARNGCLLRGLHSGVKVPDLLLRTFQIGFRARSAFLLRYRAPVSPGHGRFFASGPLHFHRLARLTAPPALHSPSGLLHPSGSKRSTAFAACRPAFRIRPIPFAPRRRFYFKFGCGSSFLVRYVSGGLLFLKPLGTSLNMLPTRVFGQCFLCESPFSSTFICFVSNRLQG